MSYDQPNQQFKQKPFFQIKKNLNVPISFAIEIEITIGRASQETVSRMHAVTISTRHLLFYGLYLLSQTIYISF